MPNSLQSSAIASPASRRATNCSLSSITEHSFQGITPSPLRGESVTYVSGTMCYLCLRSLITLQSTVCSYFETSSVHPSNVYVSAPTLKFGTTAAKSDDRFYLGCATRLFTERLLKRRDGLRQIFVSREEIQHSHHLKRLDCELGRLK